MTLLHHMVVIAVFIVAGVFLLSLFALGVYMAMAFVESCRDRAAQRRLQ